MRLDLESKIEAGEAMPLVTLHGSNGNVELFQKGYTLFTEYYGDDFHRNQRQGCDDVYHRVENPTDESLDVELYRRTTPTTTQQTATTSRTFRQIAGELTMLMLQSGYTVEAVVPEKGFRF